MAAVSCHDVVLPRFAEGMTEAFVAEWYVDVGSLVTEGEPLVELITDKVNTVMDAPVSGRVLELCFEAEERVAVGEVLAVVESEGPANVDAAVRRTRRAASVRRPRAAARTPAPPARPR